jgi:hypothetical protein
LFALGTIAVLAGAVRLAASMMAADVKGRRNAMYWLAAGALAATAAL